MILYVNSCVRKGSRTDRLARVLLEKLGDEVLELKLEDENLKPYSEEMVDLRMQLAAAGDFSHEMFRWARSFAQADEIVIAAPHWDLSFPSLLKMFIENIYVVGLVSCYNEQGVPQGLCRGKKLYYVVTSGGPYNPDFSYKYVETLCKVCFGIEQTELICAEMLDVVGFDAEKILADVEKSIRERGEK